MLSRFWLYLPALALVTLSGCESIRIATPPAAPPAFSPVGESRECASCGARAVAVCGPDSHPRWFGFGNEGGCEVECVDGTRGNEDLTYRGTPLQACAYDLTVTLATSEEVCPSGEPTTGDRDFAGHGPRVAGRVTVGADPRRTSLVPTLTATWTETDPDDGSSITLAPTPLARSVRSFAAEPIPRGEALFIQGLRLPGDRAFSADLRVPFDRVMESREESVLLAPGGDSAVHQLIVVGDTDAGDISDDADCGDDARVRAVVFNPIVVRIGPDR